MSDERFREGQPVLYRRRGSDSFELGVVKSVREDGRCFVWYSGGDTAALTPADCLFAFGNDAEGALRAHKPDAFGECRYENIRNKKGEQTYRFRCSGCGFEVGGNEFEWDWDARVGDDVPVTPLFLYCPGCGARVEGGTRE